MKIKTNEYVNAKLIIFWKICRKRNKIYTTLNNKNNFII